MIAYLMDAFKQIKYSVILLLFSVFLTSCMVGPDFHTPKEPALKRYTSSPLPKKTVGTSGLDGKPQRFLTSKTIPREWWKLFHSKELNQLIQVGIANSPNIASARASLLEAKENLYAEIGSGLFPTISASLGVNVNAHQMQALVYQIQIYSIYLMH